MTRKNETIMDIWVTCPSCLYKEGLTERKKKPGVEPKKQKCLKCGQEYWVKETVFYRFETSLHKTAFLPWK